MAEVARSVIAAAPPQAVWALLTDFERASEWLPFGSKVVSTEGVGGGARYTIELRVRDRAVTVHSDVTLYEEGRRLALRTVSAAGRDMSGFYGGETEYAVEPHGSGTRITVTSRRTDDGGLARRVAAKAAVQAEGEIARRALEKLADLAANELIAEGPKQTCAPEVADCASGAEVRSPLRGVPPAPLIPDPPMR